MLHKWSDPNLLNEMAALDCQVSKEVYEAQDIVRKIKLAVAQSKRFRRKLQLDDQIDEIIYSSNHSSRGNLKN